MVRDTVRRPPSQASARERLHHCVNKTTSRELCGDREMGPRPAYPHHPTQ